MARRANLTAVVGLDSRRFRRGMSRIVGMGRRLGRSLKKALRIDMRKIITGGAIGFGVLKTLQKSFDFERLRVQFGVLLRDMEAGKRRFQEILDITVVTPFQLEELAKVSKSLEVVSISGKQNIAIMKQLGDAAATIEPEKLEDIANAFQRFVAEARAGTVGRSTLQLMRLGVITDTTKDSLQEMALAGEDMSVMLGVIQNDFARFAGGMKLGASTGHGLFSTMKDNWNVTLAAFGDALGKNTKGAMRLLITEMQRLRADGSIKKWADQTEVVLFTLIGTVVQAIKGVKEAQEGLGKLGSAITGTLFSGIIKGIIKLAKIIGPILGNGIKAGLLDALAEVFPRLRSKAEQAKMDFERGIAGIEASANLDDRGFLDKLRDVLDGLKKFKLEIPKVELPPLPEAPAPLKIAGEGTETKNVSELQRMGAHIIRGQLDPNKAGKFERIGLTTEEKQVDLMEQLNKVSDQQLKVLRRMLEKKDRARF